MNFLRKLQDLPEGRRKAILWSVAIIIGLGLLTFYVKSVQKRIKSLEGEKIREEFQVPKLQEELESLPKFEMPELEIPEISEEELKALEEELKK